MIVTLSELLPVVLALVATPEPLTLKPPAFLIDTAVPFEGAEVGKFC